jgi:hypothetical protein
MPQQRRMRPAKSRDHQLSAAILVASMAPICALGIVPRMATAQILSSGMEDFRPPPDARWRQITYSDVQAAYRLIRDNHPGAAPELLDLAFRNSLAEAHALATRRASSVTSYEGYTAVLAGFATGLADKHIWSRPTYVLNVIRWPGLILSKHSSSWIVTDVKGDKEKDFLGDTVVDCDNTPIDELARHNLGGFRAVWRIGAQQIQAAPWLWVDERNPFVRRPAVCTLLHADHRRTLRLDWQAIRRTDLLPRLQKAGGAGKAGFGIRHVGDGYWISIQRLDDRAAEVIREAQSQQTELRAAPFVVLDLRGNGGGSSLFGRDLAKVLFGSDPVEARLGPVSDEACGGGDGSWRASADNILDLEFLLKRLGDQNGPEFRKIMQTVIDDARLARAQGRSFSGPTSCHRSAASLPSATEQPKGMQGRLILLTDNLCFSSCLAVTDDFRHLGAYHVGQTTDAATRFTEVREQYLPSGYSVFSTLQSVAIGDPPEEGPFAPTLPYPGDIADTAALEAWVIGTVVPAATAARPQT